METVLLINDNALLLGIEHGITLFVIIMLIALGIIFKEVRPQRRLLAIMVALVISFAIGQHFTNVQSALILRGDTIVITSVRSPNVLIPVDDIESMEEYRQRVEDLLIIDTRTGDRYFIHAKGERRLTIARAVAIHVGMDHVETSGRNRWVRTKGQK